MEKLRLIFKYLSDNGWFREMDDEKYLKYKYFLATGKKLHLNPPVEYTEKLQWLKLYDHRSVYTTMVDKIAVKEYVANIIGSEYVIPTIAVWEHPESIDWNELPERFVIKCNHDSGSCIVCNNPEEFDIVKARHKIEYSFNRNYYKVNREWPYKNIKPKVFAEKNISEGDIPIEDYKFFCFDGIPKIMYISNDASKNPVTNFFDMEFNHLPITIKDGNGGVLPPKPDDFEKMIELASVLSEGIPHVRVDFYYVGGKIYFGEYTFFHCAGFTLPQPEEWSYKMGDWIRLP